MSNLGLHIERVKWGDPKFQEAKDLEFCVFGVENGFVNQADRAAREMLTYRNYERSTEFYIAYHSSTHLSNPVGIVRFIRFDPNRGCRSFSTLNDAQSYTSGDGPPLCYLDEKWLTFFQTFDPTRVGELATQAVVHAHRRRGVVEHMWDAIIDASERDGISIWTMALVVPLFRWYKAMFPTAVQAIGRIMPQYVGADSVPALIQIDHREVKEYQQRFRSGKWRSVAGSTDSLMTVRLLGGLR